LGLTAGIGDRHDPHRADLFTQQLSGQLHHFSSSIHRACSVLNQVWAW
jgi:hypothetical protein